MKKVKVIVAHPGKQHSFRMAEALKRDGRLFRYITTVYDKKISFTHLLIKVLKGDNLKRALTRKCDGLLDEEVIQFNEIEGLFLILLRKIDHKKILYNRWEDYIRKSFGKKVAKYALKNKVDAIVVYDTNALYIGRYLKKRKSNIRIIMDVAAANRDFMKEIYEKDMEICPTFSKKLYQERRELWNNTTLSKLREENNYIDYFIVPSNFVKKSLLINSEIKKEKIYICPFGSNFEINKNKNFTNENKLNLVYIGNVTAMKGIYYLLESLMHFSKEEVTLKLIGNYDNSNGEFTKYFDRCEFIGLVTHDQIQKLCLDAHVFIFPSLGEGMSLAAIEALSMGLPCIVSENSGINDFIENGYNGYVVPVQRVDILIEKIKWFLENLNLLPEMSENAINTAKTLTWENYEQKISVIMEEILDS